MLKLTANNAQDFLHDFSEPAVWNGIDDVSEDIEHYDFVIFRPDIVHFGQKDSIQRKAMFLNWHVVDLFWQNVKRAV